MGNPFKKAVKKIKKEVKRINPVKTLLTPIVGKIGGVAGLAAGEKVASALNVDPLDPLGDDPLLDVGAAPDPDDPMAAIKASRKAQNSRQTGRASTLLSKGQDMGVEQRKMGSDTKEQLSRDYGAEADVKTQQGKDRKWEDAQKLKAERAAKKKAKTGAGKGMANKLKKANTLLSKGL